MKTLRIILALIYVVLIALLFILKGCEKEPEPRKAMIQVVDADTEEPIEGARVKVKTTDPSCPSITLTTDEEGECEFEYTNPEETMTQAVASKRGYDKGTVEDLELSYFDDETLVIPLKRKDVVDEGRQIGATGKLKVTLLWEDENVDLDLHVVQPNGFEIFYEEGHRRDRRTGGALDVDWIPGEGNPEHIGENIYWATPPRGTYRVSVHLYNPEEAAPTPCTVIVYREGAEPETFAITMLGYHDLQHVTEVTVQ